MSARAKIIEIIADAAECQEQDISDASNIDTLGLDSLGMMEVVMECEDEFELDIPDAEADKFGTVGDLILYIEAKVRPISGGGKLPDMFIEQDG